MARSLMLQSRFTAAITQATGKPIAIDDPPLSLSRWLLRQKVRNFFCQYQMRRNTVEFRRSFGTDQFRIQIEPVWIVRLRFLRSTLRYLGHIHRDQTRNENSQIKNA